MASRSSKQTTCTARTRAAYVACTVPCTVLRLLTLTTRNGVAANEDCITTSVNGQQRSLQLDTTQSVREKQVGTGTTDTGPSERSKTTFLKIHLHHQEEDDR